MLQLTINTVFKSPNVGLILAELYDPLAFTSQNCCNLRRQCFSLLKLSKSSASEIGIDFFQFLWFYYVYSAIGEGDSIIGVLGMKDKMQMHREIDSLDIVNTVNIDTGLEKERNDASMATTELLIAGMYDNSKDE